MASSSNSPQPYAIRVDGTDAAPLIKVLDADGGAYLVVKELEDSNPHFHAVVHSVRKLAAVRQQLKRALPNGGNGAYSCTLVRDLSKYQRYMMKGGSQHEMAQVTAAHGMEYTNADWQQETHDAYWDEAAEIQRKRKKAPLTDVVLQKCKEAKYNWQNREMISQTFIRELVDREKPINIFSLKAQVNLIQVKLCPDDSALEDLARQI